VQIINEKGFKNAAALLGGYEAWRDAKLPITTGDAK
jgi:rhodanese-related sulfurtransferase